MTSRFELIYGYWNSSGLPKKVAKITGRKQSNDEIEDLIIIQYDMNLFHYSLHNTEREGKQTRYHMQANFLDMIAEEDRKKFPEVLQMPLPEIQLLPSPFSLQHIPIHPQADDDRNLYSAAKDSELKRNSDYFADISEKNYGRQTGGLLSFYLISKVAEKNLTKFRDSIGDNIFLWSFYNETKPGILAVMKFLNFCSENSESQTESEKN